MAPELIGTKSKDELMASIISDIYQSLSVEGIDAELKISRGKVLAKQAMGVFHSPCNKIDHAAFDEIIDGQNDRIEAKMKRIRVKTSPDGRFNALTRKALIDFSCAIGKKDAQDIDAFIDKYLITISTARENNPKVVFI